jgi:hypothetical protein
MVDWGASSGSASQLAGQFVGGAGSDYGLLLDSTCGYYGAAERGSSLHVEGKRGVDLRSLLLAQASGEQRCESMCVWRFLVGIMASMLWRGSVWQQRVLYGIH